jgi:hypothetical protein
MSLLETVSIMCPYCGEPNEVVVDTSVWRQEYIEDCTVCCRPILLRIVVGEEGEIAVDARSENE